jgi:hypothetical protein
MKKKKLVLDCVYPRNNKYIVTPRESRGPELNNNWIPASAGMTNRCPRNSDDFCNRALDLQDPTSSDLYTASAIDKMVNAGALSTAPQHKVTLTTGPHSRMFWAGIQKKSLDARLRAYAST